MSSHLLSEVQQTCDRVAIINKGRTLLQESLADLLNRAGGVYFEVDEPDRAVAVLAAANIDTSVGSEAGTAWAEVGRERIGELNSLLVGAGLVVSGAGARSSDLESVFLEVTGDDDSVQASGN
jgi:ABC-2 type transport system ATP-binding protein